MAGGADDGLVVDSEESLDGAGGGDDLSSGPLDTSTTFVFSLFELEVCDGEGVASAGLGVEA